MYSFNSRIRYSETGSDKLLTLTGVLNYFQDCSTFHSEDLGVGIDFLTQKNRAWLLNSWQIAICSFPALGQQIKVSTWPYDFKGTFGSRNFLMEAPDGTPYAYANSLWVYVDTSCGHPARIPKEIGELYGVEEKYPMDYAPRKIKIPELFQQTEAFSVTAANIDTNHHVNNGQYVQMAAQWLPQDFAIGQMRAEYRRSAVLGDIIIPHISHGNNLCTVSLNDTQDSVYAIIEFTRKDIE